ncbi:MAG: ATP-binding protein [Acidobacteria bacterium]|nr:ATP-binding protein [Acidobacteriota bacterium]
MTEEEMAMNRAVIREYPAKREHLTAILDDILDFGRTAGLSTKELDRLRLISEEIIVNIINYGYAGEENGSIRIEMMLFQNTGIRVTVISGGVLFNPIEAPCPDLNQPIDERTPGGLGIFLATTLAHSLTYREENGKNILIFTVVREGTEK